jgi:hypothetical protein
LATLATSACRRFHSITLHRQDRIAAGQALSSDPATVPPTRHRTQRPATGLTPARTTKRALATGSAPDDLPPTSDAAPPVPPLTRPPSPNAPRSSQYKKDIPATRPTPAAGSMAVASDFPEARTTATIERDPGHPALANKRRDLLEPRATPPHEQHLQGSARQGDGPSPTIRMSAARDAVIRLRTSGVGQPNCRADCTSGPRARGSVGHPFRHRFVACRRRRVEPAQIAEIGG